MKMFTLIRRLGSFNTGDPEICSASRILRDNPKDHNVLTFLSMSLNGIFF